MSQLIKLKDLEGVAPKDPTHLTFSKDQFEEGFNNIKVKLFKDPVRHGVVLKGCLLTGKNGNWELFIKDVFVSKQSLYLVSDHDAYLTEKGRILQNELRYKMVFSILNISKMRFPKRVKIKKLDKV